MRTFDIARLFRQAVDEAGLDAPTDVIIDGRIHRFPTNGKPNDDAGWYIVFDDGVPYAVFGCWRSGVRSTWSAMRADAMTPAQYALRREQVKRAERQREQVAARGAAGRAEAACRLAGSKPVQSHPYLKAKGVDGPMITAAGGQLLVPFFDNAGILRGVQTVSPGGQKRFLRGGQISGNYHLIGKVATVVVVCEGYATGLTIHHCTGLPVAVAFCAGNLKAVACSLRRK